MSYKIVWKLCEKEGSKLVSAVAYNEGTKLRYELGKSTKPRVGLLFAFETKEDAFKGKTAINYNSIVVKCKGRISRRPVPEYVAFYDYYKEYWDCLFGKVNREYSNSRREMPSGTVFCTEIIPIKVDNKRDKNER